MASFVSPNIIEDNMQFFIDPANPRSYFGTPTVNLYAFPQAAWNGSTIATTYLSDSTATQTLTYVPGVENPIGSPGVFRYTSGTSGYKFFSLRTAGLPTNTYTYSYYARISNGVDSNLNNQQLWRDSEISDRAVTGDWNPTFTNQWARYVSTAPLSNGGANCYLDLFLIHSGNLTGGFTVDFCGFQLQSGSTVTPWVNGTRGTTVAANGGVIDISTVGNRYNLEIVGSPTYSTSGGGSIVLNGSSDWLRTSTSVPNLNITNNLTLESWVRPTSTSVGGIFNYGSETLEQYALWWWSSNTFAFTSNWPSTWYQGVTSSSYTINNWYHVCATFLSNAWKIYVNGTLAGSGTFAITSLPVASGGLLGLGNNHGGGDEHFTGNIGQTRVYSTALTENQVKQNFYAQRIKYGV
jgi:hypothetical protein